MEALLVTEGALAPDELRSPPTGETIVEVKSACCAPFVPTAFIVLAFSLGAFVTLYALRENKTLNKNMFSEFPGFVWGSGPSSHVAGAPELEALSRLESLAAKHESDKRASRHNYVLFYARKLHDWEKQPIHLLEVGIGSLQDDVDSSMNWLKDGDMAKYQPGASLRMWADWFHHAKTVVDGVDVANTHAGRRLVYSPQELHFKKGTLPKRFGVRRPSRQISLRRKPFT